MNTSLPSVYLLKPGFQSLLRPGVDHLARIGVTANQVTLTTSGLCLAFGLWMLGQPEARSALFAFPVLLILRMALNAADGMLAVEHGQRSRFGAALNEVSDVVSDTALYLPFVFWHEFSPIWMGAVVALLALPEVAGLAAIEAGGKKPAGGPMGKSDRALVFGALALWRAFAGPIPHWAATLFPQAMLAALLLTALNRICSYQPEERNDRTRRGMSHQ